MSGRAAQLYSYAAELERIKVSMVQLRQYEIARSLESPIELLRKEAELELMEYQRRYHSEGG